LGEEVSRGWERKCQEVGRGSIRRLGDVVSGGWERKCQEVGRGSVRRLGEEVSRGWERKCQEVGSIVRNLYFSPSIFRTIKSLRMRWAGYIALNSYKVSQLRPGGKNDSEDLFIQGAIEEFG
jgi:hypothetical protein